MLKKIILFILLILNLFSSVNCSFVYAKEIPSKEDRTFKEIDEILVKNDIVYGEDFYGGKITKAECVRSILKLIGFNKDIARYYHVVIVHPKRSFQDVNHKIFDNCEENEYIVEYLEQVGKHKLIMGEKVDENTTKFYPNEYITISECLEIMNNCLSKYKSDNIFLESMKNGLINYDDEFLYKIDKTKYEKEFLQGLFLEATRRNFEEKQDKLLFKMHDDLSYEVFCCLLNRMMKHKMGYYYDYSKYDEQYYFKFARDNYKMKNKTYLDYFKVQTLDRKFYKSIEEIRRKREDMGIEKDYEYEEYILTGTICIY